MKRIYQIDEKGWRYCQPAFWQKEPMEITLTMPIDMTNADLLRKEIGKKNKTHISVNSLIIKAVADALEEFPIISGMWLSEDKIWVPNPGETLISYTVQSEDSIRGGEFINNASQKGLLEISRELNARITEIRSKGVDKLIDLSVEFPPKRPFFYIAGIGAIGPVESCTVGRLFSSSAPIAAVLAVCAISEKPQALDGRIQIRKMMNACLIFDHRAMMPNTGVEFLTQLKRNLEKPSTYLV